MPAMQRALKTGSRVALYIFVVAAFGTFFVSGILQALAKQALPQLPSNTILILSLLIFGALAVGVLHPILRASAAKRFDQLLPPTLTRLRADETGLTIADELSHGYWDWRHVRGAVATPDGVGVLVGYGGIFVPRSAFRDATEQAGFVEMVNARSDRSPIQGETKTGRRRMT